MKGVKILVPAVLIIAIVGGILWRTSRPAEPVYHGHTLDAFLNDMSLPGRINAVFTTSEYSEALNQMGDKAVPFIFRKLEQNDSPLRNKYRDAWPKLPGFLRKLLPQPKPMNFDVYSAGLALTFTCQNATPIIIDKLNDGNPAVREAAWYAFSSTTRRSLSNTVTFSLCLPALKDKAALVRMFAAASLGRIGPAASNAVPALLPLFSSSESGRRPGERAYVHASCAMALGEIGPAASNAVPALTNLVATGDNYTSVTAAIALWQITSNENLALPVIIKELPAFSPYHKQMPVNALKAMGPLAKSAFPVLLSELPRAVGAHQREYITDALKAIDPEAAAQAGIK